MSSKGVPPPNGGMLFGFRRTMRAERRSGASQRSVATTFNKPKGGGADPPNHSIVTR